MLKIAISLILLFIQFQAAAGPIDQSKVVHGFKKINPLNLDARLRNWAETFLGTPYDSNGPLGEGRNGSYDQDPLHRFDYFDCTTFVETVVSLSRSSDLLAFKASMKEIRYEQGRVGYLTRNHIISLQWVPRNINNGIFKDAQWGFPPKYINEAEGVLDFSNWLKFHTSDRLKVPNASPEELAIKLENLHIAAEDFTPDRAVLSYLSINELLNDWNLFSQTAEGSYVLSVVRPNWNLVDIIGTNLHISHQGIMTKEDGLLYFTHASSAGKVVKVKLENYLKKYRDHKTVKGIHLLKVLK